MHGYNLDECSSLEESSQAYFAEAKWFHGLFLLLLLVLLLCVRHP